MKIGIVEDDELFLRAITKNLCTDLPAAEICGWSSAEDCLADIDQKDLELLIADIRLPNMSGVEMVGRIHKRQPDLIIMMLTSMDSEDYIFHAFQAGAIGYILKAEIEQISALVNRVIGGESVISPTIAIKLAKIMEQQQEDSSVNLNDLERDLLQEIANAKTVQQIAEKNQCPERKIWGDIRRIYRKLHAREREQLFEHVEARDI